MKAMHNYSNDGKNIIKRLIRKILNRNKTLTLIKGCNELTTFCA